MARPSESRRPSARPAARRGAGRRLRLLLGLAAELGLLVYLLPLGDRALPAAPVLPLDRARAISLGRSLRADDVPAPPAGPPSLVAVVAGADPAALAGPALDPGGPGKPVAGRSRLPLHGPDLSRSPPGA